jgi:molybdopterin converting factor small subunit
MRVTVRVHGALRSAALGSGVALSLPESATAGDVLARLADRFGAPFSSVAASRDARLPREIRLSVGGELVALRDEPLAAHDPAEPVTVVVLSPISGG